MVMLGNEAERVFGRSNWKDLYSVIRGGGEYRAVTPEGDVVGKLDARFVNSPDASEFSLGGRSWSMVKCDEGHNIVVVVPHESEKSRVFWAGGGVEGYSPLICRAMQQIIARRGSVLPLGDPEQETLKEVFLHIPEGIDERGIFVRDKKSNRGKEVIVYSFYGSRFNRVLSLLIRYVLGSRVQVRYSDFAVTVQRAGKVGAAEIVAGAIRKIPELSIEMIGKEFPLPDGEAWKFAQALTPASFRDMVLSDYYHADEFHDIIENVPVTVLPAADQDNPAPES
jgi:ATP-dependent helicase Lhr and Lhr-like helicase